MIHCTLTKIVTNKDETAINDNTTMQYMVHEGNENTALEYKALEYTA
jgi:hypothetical protein